MLCPECGSRSRVVNLDHKADGAHRWRRCLVCDHSFRTLETHFTNPEPHPACVLTPENVRDIRRRAATGETQECIAAAYGMNRKTISAIIHRKSWKNVS